MKKFAFRFLPFVMFNLNTESTGVLDAIDSAPSTDAPAVETVTAPEPVETQTVETVADPAPGDVAKKKRKKKEAVAVVAKPAKVKKSTRGRKPVYVGEKGKAVMGLLRKYKNASKVRAILNSGNSKKDADLRAERIAAGFEKPLGISLPTLFGLAVKARLKLRRGRPVEKTAKKAA